MVFPTTTEKSYFFVGTLTLIFDIDSYTIII